VNIFQARRRGESAHSIKRQRAHHVRHHENNEHERGGAGQKVSDMIGIRADSCATSWRQK
jgi:hypothetical protein